MTSLFEADARGQLHGLHHGRLLRGKAAEGILELRLLLRRFRLGHGASFWRGLRRRVVLHEGHVLLAAEGRRRVRRRQLRQIRRLDPDDIARAVVCEGLVLHLVLHLCELGDLLRLCGGLDLQARLLLPPPPRLAVLPVTHLGLLLVVLALIGERHGLVPRGALAGGCLEVLLRGDEALPRGRRRARGPAERPGPPPRRRLLLRHVLLRVHQLPPDRHARPGPGVDPASRGLFFDAPRLPRRRVRGRLGSPCHCGGAGAGDNRRRSTRCGGRRPGRGISGSLGREPISGVRA
mmetsp:Transcript_32371/g.94735  ORF Transcript_32371/g.94735 Transcript_32371/m.94735 type:complete len:292 (+) Transcript_32371:819-1694(+)